MEAEKIEWMRGWARKHNCRLVLDAEVGFGRQCVGIQQAESSGVLGASWLSYGWYGMEGSEEDNKKVNQLVANAAPVNAYHKDDFVCVLGEGFDALEQLYDWLVCIDAAGLTTELVNEADLGPGTTTMSLMVSGKRARIRRLCRDNGATD